MLTIDIQSIPHRDTFKGDDITDVFTLTENFPQDVMVYVSGLFLTEDIDYTLIDNEVHFTETPSSDENINIVYNT